MPTAPQRFAVIHQGALGDFLLALAALEGLHSAHPAAIIDVWSKDEHLALIVGKPYFGQGHSSAGSELLPFYHESLWQTAQIPPFFRTATVVFLFGQAGHRLPAERLSNRLSRPVHWVQSFPTSGEPPQPVVPFLMGQLERLGWAVPYRVPLIEPTEEARSTIRSRMAQLGLDEKSRPIVIHPGSGGRKKIWPLLRWWSLLQWLGREYPQHPMLLTLGPADEHLYDFARAAQPQGVRYLDTLSLTEMGALLAESRLYFGNDSGISHLAGAVGACGVVFFGPTDPTIWAPQSPRIHIIRSRWHEEDIFNGMHRGVEASELECEVQEAVRRGLAS